MQKWIISPERKDEKMRIKRILRRMLGTMCAAVLALSMVSCGNEHTKKSDSSSSTSSSKTESSSEIAVDESKSFIITLYPEYAPESCEHFEELVKNGFYNGLVFHRVYPGFMAQAGVYTSNGEARADSKMIKGEFSSNGFAQNTLKHNRGVVSMARATNPNSASSQFFICYIDNITHLDGNYAAFGKVTKGMEVVDGFTEIERKMGTIDEIPTVPTKPIVILKAEMIEDDGEGHHQAKFYMQY